MNTQVSISEWSDLIEVNDGLSFQSGFGKDGNIHYKVFIDGKFAAQVAGFENVLAVEKTVRR
jgi:hypothetical protein